AIEFPIAEIAPEQAEFPHVISNVFADVSYRAVGADDNFLALSLTQLELQRSARFLFVFILGFIMIATCHSLRRNVCEADPLTAMQCIDLDDQFSRVYLNFFGDRRNPAPTLRLTDVNSSRTCHDPTTGVFTPILTS